MKAAVVLALMGALAAPLPAAAGDAPERTAQKTAAADEIRCERLPVTGSRARKIKVCMTNAEWKAQARGGRDTAQAIQDQGSITGVRPE